MTHSDEPQLTLKSRIARIDEGVRHWVHKRAGTS